MTCAPAAGSVFADDWLARRERADHRSRAHDLTRAAARYLARYLARTGGEHAVIVDLGAGRGSNVRYLAPRLPGPRHWRLLEQDPALLAALKTMDIPKTDSAEIQAIDLAGDIAPALAGTHLVTASALADLVSAAWIRRLSAACAAQRSAVLIALTVDGTLAFDNPADPDDVAVRSALAADQQSDKGFGAALGPRAPAALIDALAARGFAVTAMPSPWRLGAADRALAAALIDGWREAAARQRPDQAPRLTAWANRRAQMIADGESGLVLGHIDVLALPGPAQAARRKSRS